MKLIPNELNRVVRADMTNGANFMESARKLYDELMFRFSRSLIFLYPVVSLSERTFISKVLPKEKFSDALLPRDGTPYMLS